MPLNDKKVFKSISKGDLENIYMLENSSLSPMLSQFKPNSMHDLSIINAMSRQGIANYFPYVINNKFNTEEIFCFSDIRVSNLLKETYGLLIYQETFLHLSKEIAGISFKEANVWKSKIMRSRNDIDLMEFRTVFTNGCATHSSLDKIEIDFLTNMVVVMLRFTFQKSHSLSYSLIGYWGAYYKSHFRKQFNKIFNN